MPNKEDREVRLNETGDPGVLGVTKKKQGYNFAVSVPKGKEAYLLLYKMGETKPSKRFYLSRRTGRIAAALAEGIDPGNWEYNYEIGGEVVQDPYAAAIRGLPDFGGKIDEEKGHQVRCAFVSQNFDWKGDRFPAVSLADSIFYKLHVRGFTMQKDSKVRDKGTFRGLMQKIAYLKGLGVTGVELMPAYEFQERQQRKEQDYRRREDETLLNYWGYTDRAFYFAPKAAYARSDNPVREMKELVRTLHENGLECVMEFYFTREIPPVQIRDILHHWKLHYHIDGFHLVGEGIPQDMICRDPLLTDTKLFFGNIWEESPVSSGCRNRGEYNEGFRQDMKRFLKGDEDMLQAFAYRARRNPDSYGVINYLTVQDGFTLEDSVSYEMKHNEANKEANQDGPAYNFSWNCGLEGPTRKRAVCALRQQQVKNAVLLLLLSQGTPLWYQGDEFGNSQQGNNNAYCQDNEIGWVDWSRARRQEKLTEFVRSCIAFRKAHPVLHMETEPKVSDYKSYGCPDLSYHSQKAWSASFDNNLHHLGLMYCGAYGNCDSVYIAYNMHWNTHEFALPHLKQNQKWYPVMDTSRQEMTAFLEKPATFVEGKVIKVPPRTIVVLVGQTGEI